MAEKRIAPTIRAPETTQGTRVGTRGLLTLPEVEEAAFSLQPGGISEVIRRPMGCRIVQVAKREWDRPTAAWCIPAAEG